MRKNFRNCGLILVLLGANEMLAGARGQVVFAPAVVHPGYNIGSIDSGDIDGDGDRDLVMDDLYNVAWAPNLGEGTFGLRHVFACGNYPTDWIVAADFDDDSNLDVAAGNNWSNGPALRELAVALNNGNGTFGTAFTISLSESPGRLVAGDLTGDGLLEIVFALPTGLQVFVNIGGGTFVAGQILASTAPDHAVVADLDGDSDLDLATAAAPSSTPSVRLDRNLGGGLLISAGTTPAVPVGGEGLQGLAAADPDLAGTRFPATNQGPVTGGSVLIWRNVGNLTFQAPSTIAAGGYLFRIAAADLDRDGFLDLLVTDGYTNRLLGLRGLGGATYAPPVSFAYSAGGTMTVADLNGDGDEDAAVGGAHLSILENLDPTGPLAPYPGSGEDFHLASGVNETPTTGPGLTVKTARAQDILGVRLASP